MEFENWNRNIDILSNALLSNLLMFSPAQLLKYLFYKQTHSQFKPYPHICEVENPLPHHVFTFNLINHFVAHLSCLKNSWFGSFSSVHMLDYLPKHAQIISI